MVAASADEPMSTAEVAQRGVALVREEAASRGGNATPSGEPRAQNRLVLRTPDGRRLDLYVKTRRRGDWQSDTRLARPRDPASDETSFWVFVDMLENPPAFYVAPTWWVENDIFEVHREYLARHGGRRARNPSATHHRITTDRVEQWRGRWDLVGLA